MGAGPAEARLEPARSSRPAPTGRRLGGLPPTRRAAAETAEYPCQVAKGRPIAKCLGYASLLGMTTVVERLCERCLGTYQADADSHCLAMGELAIGQPGTVVGFRDRADMTVARRLFDLGFAVGVSVQLVRKAPLRDPLIFRVGSSEMLLRRTEADLIMVKVA